MEVINKGIRAVTTLVSYITIPMTVKLLADDASEKAKQKLAFLWFVLLPFAFGFSQVFSLSALGLATLALYRPLDIGISRFILQDDSKLASKLLLAGRPEEALALKNVKDLERILCLKALAEKLIARKDFTKAVEYLREAKTLIDQASPLILSHVDKLDDESKDRWVDAADALNNLATTLQEGSDFDKDEVESLFEQAISLGASMRGRDLPQVTIWIMNLGIYKQQQLLRYAESLELYEEVLRIRQTLLGQDDPLVADWMVNMAYLLLSRPDASDIGDKIMGLVQGALDIRRRLYGNESEVVANTLNDCALMSALTGKEGDDSGFLRARKFGEEAARMYEQVLGKDHPKAVKARTDWSV